MATFLTFTLVGLTIAAIYAVIASGLVLTYTTTGVFNFAHGAIGTIAAFAYWQLRVGWEWPTWLALLVVLGVVAPAVGAGVDLAMRGLSNTAETTRLVVSLSLLFGFITLAQALWNPGVARVVPEFFAGKSLGLGPSSVSGHQLVTIATAVAVAVGLQVLLRRTRLGVSMRAVVDNPTLSELNGASARRVQQTSWILSAVLASVGGVLVASSAGLNAILLSTLIVNAYSAAIFGRLRSLLLTLVGALVVGLTEGYLLGYLPKGNANLAGLRLSAPALILLVVLLVMPNTRLRQAVTTREFFSTPSRGAILAFGGFVMLVGAMIATTVADRDALRYGSLFGVAIVAVSLVPLMGYANQVSLCQLSLAGIGALTYAHWGSPGSPVGLLVAMLVCAVAGALVALPAMRLSGIYLALATAALAVTLDRWVFTIPSITLGRFTFGLFETGSVTVEPLRLGSWVVGNPRVQLVLSCVVFVKVATGLALLRRGRWGRRLIAIRDSEAACATLGINLLSARVGVFALSAAIAGLGGALTAMSRGSIRAQDYEFVSGLPLLLMVAAGGAGFVSAGFTAALVLEAGLPLGSTFLPWASKWLPLSIGGAGVSLVRNPSGLGASMAPAITRAAARPQLVGSAVGGGVLAWLLRLAGVIDNWPFVVALCAILVAVVAALVRDAETTALVGTSPASAPAALRGREFDTELAQLDRALGITGPPYLASDAADGFGLTSKAAGVAGLTSKAAGVVR